MQWTLNKWWEKAPIVALVPLSVLSIVYNEDASSNTLYLIFIGLAIWTLIKKTVVRDGEFWELHGFVQKTTHVIGCLALVCFALGFTVAFFGEF